MRFISEMSKREKNIWAMLVLDVAISIYYFSRVLNLPVGVGIDSAEMGGIIISVIIYAVIGSIVVYGIANWEPNPTVKDSKEAARKVAERKIAYCIFGTLLAIFLSLLLIESIRSVFNQASDIVDLGPITASLGWLLFISFIIYLYTQGSSREEPTDERDTRIEMRANHVAYSMLVIAIVVVMSIIALNGSTLNSSVFGMVQITPMLNAHMLLFALLITTAVKALMQLYLYRRGE